MPNLTTLLCSTMLNTVKIGFMLGFVVTCVSAQYTEGRAYSQSERTRYAHKKNLTCTQSQSNIDFNEILGLWKVREVIEHSERYTDRHNYLRTAANSESCPRVHFAQDDTRRVRMLWYEEDGYIQFEFDMPNIMNPGYWMSSPWQTGTLVDSSYKHFTGNVQVMKAVQSHLVLTFCSPQEKHFSVILARNYLSQEEIRGVHKQLTRINLPLVNIQNYCSSGVLNVPSLAIMFLMTFVSCRQWMS